MLAWWARPHPFADDLTDAEALAQQGFQRYGTGGDVAPMLFWGNHDACFLEDRSKRLLCDQRQLPSAGIGRRRGIEADPRAIAVADQALTGEGFGGSEATIRSSRLVPATWMATT